MISPSVNRGSYLQAGGMWWSYSALNRQCWGNAFPTLPSLPVWKEEARLVLAICSLSFCERPWCGRRRLWSDSNLIGMWLIWEALKAVKLSQKEISIVLGRLKENDHFKIHNSQVPTIYSWGGRGEEKREREEKKTLSELLFIKRRGREGGSLRMGGGRKGREKEIVCGNV